MSQNCLVQWTVLHFKLSHCQARVLNWPFFPSHPFPHIFIRILQCGINKMKRKNWIIFVVRLYLNYVAWIQIIPQSHSFQEKSVIMNWTIDIWSYTNCWFILHKMSWHEIWWYQIAILLLDLHLFLKSTVHFVEMSFSSQKIEMVCSSCKIWY